MLDLRLLSVATFDLAHNNIQHAVPVIFTATAKRTFKTKAFNKLACQTINFT